MLRLLNRKATRLEVPHFKQEHDNFCGPAVLQMVFAYFTFQVSQDELAEKMGTRVMGTKPEKLIEVATDYGFYAYENLHSTVAEIEYLLNMDAPVIVNYTEPSEERDHYAVAVGYDKNKLFLNDPWNGKNFKLTKKEFLSRWFDADANPPRYRWLVGISDKSFNLGHQHLPKERQAI